jgi:hypothetical protein
MSAGLGALLLYLRTVAPALPPGDSGEFITAAWVLGVPHPPGYPLYTLLARFAEAVPLGSPALRVNALSAVLGAAAVAATALLLLTLLAPVGGRAAPASTPALTHAGVAAAVGALLLGASTVFWSYALVAEVFALNALFAALLLLLALAWARGPESRPLLGAFGLGCGLAASHHHTIVLFAPAFLVLLGWGIHRLGVRAAVPALAIAVGLLLVGLVPYIYLPLAAAQDPPLNWGNPRTLESFIRHVTRADYGTFRLVLQQEASGSPVEQVALFGRYLFGAFTPIGCLLAGLGAWWLARARPVAGLALLLAFLVSGPAFVAYANPAINDPLVKGVVERFYILPSVPFAAAAGAGAYQVLAWAGEWGRRARWSTLARHGWVPIGAALLALPLWSAVAHFGTVEQSNNLVTQHFGEDMLAPLEPSALLIVRGDTVTFAMDYLRVVERVRPDVLSVDMEKLKLRSYVEQMQRQHPDLAIPFTVYDPFRGAALKSFVAANLASRPVYVAGDPPDEKDFRSAFDVQRAGFSDRLVPKGTGPDRNAILREKLDLFKSLRYPSRTFPETTWEAGIARDYGRLAFDVGYVLTVDARPAEADSLYRTAIRLVPDYPLPYKNLGLVLLRLGGDTSEVATLWEQYLRLNPADPEAPAMRQQLERLRARPAENVPPPGP